MSAAKFIKQQTEVRRRNIAHDIAFQASRLDVPGVLGEFSAKDAQVHACAIVMSMLMTLDMHAQQKPLTHLDMDAAICAARAKFKVKEETTPTGATVYKAR